MEKAITTILVTIASIVAMLVVINAVIPAVGRTSGAVVGAGSALDDRIKADIEIIHAAGEPNGQTAYVWVKNVGANTLGPESRVDVFFGPDTGVSRITYGLANCTAPCWDAELENAAKWEPTSTLRITVHSDTPLATGTTYYVKVVLPNGIADAKYFTL